MENNIFRHIIVLIIDRWGNFTEYLSITNYNNLDIKGFLSLYLNTLKLCHGNPPIGDNLGHRSRGGHERYQGNCGLKYK